MQGLVDLTQIKASEAPSMARTLGLTQAEASDLGSQVVQRLVRARSLHLSPAGGCACVTGSMHVRATAYILSALMPEHKSPGPPSVQESTLYSMHLHRNMPHGALSPPWCWPGMHERSL